MSISDDDRDKIIRTLDDMEDVAARIVIATLESFARWLARELPAILQKIGDQLRRIWTSIKNAFS